MQAFIIKLMLLFFQIATIILLNVEAFFMKATFKFIYVMFLPFAP